MGLLLLFRDHLDEFVFEAEGLVFHLVGAVCVVAIGITNFLIIFN
jgi:hypothetical protein